MRTKKNFQKAVALIIILTAVYSCGPDKGTETSPGPEVKAAKTTPNIFYSIVSTYPHDTTAFTEGFLFHDKKLYESTGAPEYLTQARSAIGITDLKSGKLDVKIELDKKTYFGEGIIIVNDKIYQLTYQNQVGFIYDVKTWRKTGQFNYPNKEGWGMTTDGRLIIMSDGSYNLTYINPSDFSVNKVLAVTENGYGLDRLNELEFIKGFIYANVWMTNTIVKIDPANGEVVGKMDLTPLSREATLKSSHSLEMNGIAYDSIADKILVTGKLWPTVYEISFPH
jgi:glutamine cyclotransferase